MRTFMAASLQAPPPEGVADSAPGEPLDEAELRLHFERAAQRRQALEAQWAAHREAAERRFAEAATARRAAHNSRIQAARVKRARRAARNLARVEKPTT
jgi:hypothetical protein